MSVRILIGDCRDLLRTLPDESVHCVVTSPPYWGLRDYGTGSNGIGLEKTVDEHMDALVGVFREVRRILRADGTLWLNYGDAYAGSWGAQGRGDKRAEMDARDSLSAQQIAAHSKRRQTGSLIRTGGCKAKDLMGLPWMLAFALRRSVWSVATAPFTEAHFATFPPALIEPCIKAGCPEGGTVLDPFGGAGTTGLVADRLKRNAILLELNPDYAAMAQRRIANEAGIFGDVKIERPTIAEAAE